jgi:DNA recombination-dependent growth factor C
MNSKMFKAFTPFINKAGGVPSAAMLAKLSKFESIDPSGGQWRSLGLIEVEDNGGFIMNLEGAAKLAVLQLNERILPASVQKEAMAKRIAKIIAEEDRPVTKKDYAMVRDEVAMELLPKAFIRRKMVPVIFRNEHFFVFTSSSKLCDDVTSLIFTAIGNDTKFNPVRVSDMLKNEISGSLTSLALRGDYDYDEGPWFEVDNSAVLKGESKKAIRVKDIDVESHTIQQLLKQDYRVTQLGLKFFDNENSDDADATFVVNEHFVFTKVALTGIKDIEKDAGAFFSSAWLSAVHAEKLSVALAEEFGGMKEDGEEDDEL